MSHLNEVTEQSQEVQIKGGLSQGSFSSNEKTESQSNER